MFANLDRDQFIQLLHTLGSEDDEEVLSAARDLHARVTVAGIDWDDLLVPEEEDVGDEEDEFDDDDYEDDVEVAELDDEEEDDEDIAPTADDEDRPVDETEKAEALALIDKLLERGVTETTREELNDYKTDIAEDDFLAMDLRYLKALHKRLTN